MPGRSWDGGPSRWQPKGPRESTRPARLERPDERWQTDIRYTKVSAVNYYLLSFIDVYSRYIVHHRLLSSMDGRTVATEAVAAVETLTGPQRPTIQSDHGSCFIARDFAQTLDGAGVGHQLIRPHTPTDNRIIERYHRTIGERIDEHELEEFDQACEVIAGIIGYYNCERLHSSLKYLRPIDWYRGQPEPLLAERRRKLEQARHLTTAVNSQEQALMTCFGKRPL